jgi:hypothetical protein
MGITVERGLETATLQHRGLLERAVDVEIIGRGQPLGRHQPPPAQATGPGERIAHRRGKLGGRLPIFTGGMVARQAGGRSAPPGVVVVRVEVHGVPELTLRSLDEARHRRFRDCAGRLAVTPFPLAMAKSLSASYDPVAACYVIGGDGKAYIGESKRAVKCVAENAAAPAKNFADEAYLLHEQELHALNPSALLYLQLRLIEVAEEAGLVTLTDGRTCRHGKN